MKRYPNLAIGLLFAILVFIGGQMNLRVTHLRESEAFYRWIMAAALDQDLFKNADTEFKDAELFEDVRGLGESMLPDPAGDQAIEGGKLVALAKELRGEDASKEKPIFDMARSAALEPARKRFLQLARNNQLEFARNIQYAEAQASGVSIFNMFFGFRKIAANFVWLQVDRYWHMGMMHRMIPLMKSCVVLDPNFVDAYLLGAWHLAYNVTAKMPETPQALRQWHPEYKACVGEKETYYYIAADFLKDGIRNNPRNYKLYFDLGFAVYNEKLNDYPNAVKYLSEAVRQPHERWVPRMLYKSLEQNGQYAEAKALWEEYMKRFPGTIGADDTGPRAITRLEALTAEQRAQKNFAEAEQLKDSDPETSARRLKKAQGFVEDAKRIYTSMGEPFANARLAVLNARELAKDGRYVEAIALLDRARWDYSNSNFFEEASNMIIDYKQKGNIPLSLSERKAVIRESGGEKCKGQPDDAPAANSAASVAPAATQSPVAPAAEN